MKYLQTFEHQSYNELAELISIRGKRGLNLFLLKYKYKNFNLNLDDVREYKSGSYGLILTFDDYVIKLTFDKGAYLLAKKLENKHFEHLVDVLDVNVIHSTYRSLYLIKMNKCEILNDYYINILDREGAFMYLHEGDESIIKDINYIIKNEYIATFFDNIDVFKELKDIRKELEISGLAKYKLDIHSHNIMLKNKKLCLVDFIYPTLKY